MTSYRLAPMSPLILWMTLALFAIPLAFLLLPATSGAPRGLAALGVFVLALYAAIWLFWRPGRFEVSAEGVRIVFPGRSRLVPLEDVSGCRALSREAFKAELGWAMRIGAGGLWGGFGWLWTSKQGLLDFYISRTDGFVLLTRRSTRDLLVTPESPESMIETIGSLLRG